MLWLKQMYNIRKLLEVYTHPAKVSVRGQPLLYAASNWNIKFVFL